MPLYLDEIYFNATSPDTAKKEDSAHDIVRHAGAEERQTHTPRPCIALQ
jgi:hypothetical protein